MTIRLATPFDAEQITALAAVTMREAFGPPHNPLEVVNAYIADHLTVPNLQQELSDRRSTFLVVDTSEGEPIGYAKLRRHAPPRRMTERNAIEIQRIYVKQAQIGLGLGRQLMDHCLGLAVQEHYKAVWLGVWERNERALTFYRKMGFIPFGWHYFQFGPDRQRDIWMYKTL